MAPLDTIDYHSTAGYRLRNAREQLSFSLRDVASTLNLLVSHVRAIEADRCGALASDEKFLRRVRDYANLVELDASEVVDSYREQSEAIEPIQPMLSVSKRRQRSAWIFAGTLIILCASLGGWLLTKSIDSRATDATSAQLAVAESAPDQQRAGLDQTAAGTAVEKQAANTAIVGAGSDVINEPRKRRAAGNKHSDVVDNAELRSNGRPTLAPPSRKQVAAEASVPVSAPVSTPPSKSGAQMATTDSLRSAEWFAGLDADRYTLQVLSLTKKTSARAFIQRRQLQDEAAYFAVRKNKQTLYAVTYGLYDSYQAAESAAKSLPEGIKDLNPWVRNTGRIQQSMLRAKP